MATQTPWFRRPRDVQRSEQDRILQAWLGREVLPFSSFWRDRLGGFEVADVDGLRVIPAVTEADIAGAGGAGNPALLLAPTEDQFKANAPRRELLAAARELGGRGASGRRNAIWRRYKPVHIHEAGVDRLVAIAYTRSDLDLLHLAGARLAEVLGWGAEDALLNLVPAGPSVTYWALYHAALANRMTALHPRGAGQPIGPAARRGLALLPASVLAAPTGELEGALGELHGRVAAPNLRQVVAVGRPPDAQTRARIAAQAGRVAGRPVAVQAAWAPEASRVLYGESPPAAGDPPEATYGFLTYPDLEVLEVRDPATGAVVPDGGAGELVITSMGWRGTALVRLATGTWVGGIETRENHPVTGATVPRLAPLPRDAAWQPRVRAGMRTIRPDLRTARRLIEPVAARADVRAWSLRAVDSGLVLAIDVAAGVPAEMSALADRLAASWGVRPEVRVDRALANAVPQIASAG